MQQQEASHGQHHFLLMYQILPAFFYSGEMATFAPQKQGDAGTGKGRCLTG
jgi:hypothetical protein